MGEGGAVDPHRSKLCDQVLALEGCEDSRVDVKVSQMLERGLELLDIIGVDKMSLEELLEAGSCFPHTEHACLHRLSKP